ncbi:MAG: SDR family oxidoreductase, partial [Cyanobacteria bacterium J06639_1]
MKAFVAGATGETGRRIVQTLVDRDIPVRALARDLAKAADILPATGVELVEGDVSNRKQLETAIADCTVLLCATGARPTFDPFEPYRVDLEGTKNLIDAAKSANIEHFVMVSSLCVSKFFHPLNLFWLVLFWKKQAEGYLQQSGLRYTIVRPGGLTNSDPDGGLVISTPDTLFEGRVPRSEVARVCVEALFQESARDRILEIVTRPDTPERDIAELLAAS